MPLHILPISHVATESRRKVVEAMESVNPDIVAVELDYGRFSALIQGMHKRRYFDIRKPKESLIALAFQAIQGFFGQKTGQIPGEEFLIAIRLAFERKAQVALIDQDIRLTLGNLSKAIRLPTVFKLSKLLFTGKKVEGFDLDKVPEEKLILELLRELKTEFPKIFKAMVSDRDKAMADNLKLIDKEKTVLVVVGAAHVPGLKRRLSDATIVK